MMHKTVYYWRTGTIICAGILSLPIMITLAAATGDIPVSYATAFWAITNGLGITHVDLPAVEAGIVWQYRMSRALMAASSGGGWRCAVWSCSRCCVIRLRTLTCWGSLPVPQPVPSA